MDDDRYNIKANAPVIAAINERFSQENLGVYLRQKGKYLYLRSYHFPPKPGYPQQDLQRREVTLNTLANETGLIYAERQARGIAQDIQMRTFDWAKWMQMPASSGPIVSEVVEQFRVEFLRTRKARSWRHDYQYPYSTLPQDKRLTAQMLTDFVMGTKPNSKSRQRYTRAALKLAAIAGIEFSVPPGTAGSYGIGFCAPRVLPSIEEIFRVFDGLTKHRDRWAFGIMATYGIRPHELFYLDLEAFVSNQRSLFIYEEKDTKTGARSAYAINADWIDRFDLLNICAPTTKRLYKGDAVSVWFRSADVPFNPYDLRHRWAIDAAEKGMSDTFAAASMGHGIDVHQKVYHYHLQKRDLDRAFATVFDRGELNLGKSMQIH